MWIRSQDKTRLVKTNYIRVNGNDIEAIHSDMLCTTIGCYSTKEKALKVLDKIVEEINYGDLQNVFQMPQDDEVELC